MKNSERVAKLRHLVRVLLLVAVAIGLGAVAIGGFLQGREELAREAERERPIKAPQRISFEGGEPVITLDAASQQQSGLRTVALEQTQYHEQLRAYGSVLDVQPLVDLDNSYALAKAQLNAAQARLDASRAEFEREDKLFKTQTSIVTLDKLQSTPTRPHWLQLRHNYGQSKRRQFRVGDRSLDGSLARLTRCFRGWCSVRTILCK
jgi:hypothetical protein